MFSFFFRIFFLNDFPSSALMSFFSFFSPFFLSIPLFFIFSSSFSFYRFSLSRKRRIFPGYAFSAVARMGRIYYTPCRRKKEEELRSNIKKDEQGSSGEEEEEFTAVKEEDPDFADQSIREAARGLMLDRKERKKDGERRFPCDKCGVSFNQKANLQHHWTTEKHKRGGLKPKIKFPCELCSKVFNRKEHLQRHMKSRFHTSSNKPFSCDLCSKAFLKESTLITHMKNHCN